MSNEETFLPPILPAEVSPETAEQVGRLLGNPGKIDAESRCWLYESILSATDDFAYVFDLDGRFQYANRRLLEVWGRTLPDIIGKDCLELGYPAWHAAMHGREIRQVVATKKPIIGEVPFTSQTGHFGIYEYIFTPVFGADGEVRVVAGTTRDVTARKKDEDALRVLAEQNARLLASERAARAELEHASRMKDEFLSTLSHELRTPLNAILGWAHILRIGPGGADEVAEGLAIIERNARAQTQIIEDLLDMSRIISGKVRVEVQRLDLAAVIKAAIESVKPAAAGKGVRLQAVLDSHVRPISGDPNRLQQVFWNLLSNAVRFTPRDGQVQILLERVSSHLEVSVIDSGEGIAAEFLPHVFDRFRQADASTVRRHGGLGLGLAIVKQLVELHGGTVRAKSSGLGQGSTFVVVLPLTAVHVEAGADDAERRHPSAGGGAAPSLEAKPDLRGVRVVVVDDEGDARALVKRLLEDCAATVWTAGSAAEAFALVEEQNPDVLVSDIGIPGEDGYSFIRRVRALGVARGGVPALALTAYARSEDRMKAVQAGFQMHIAKPVEVAELLAMVASLAGRNTTSEPGQSRLDGL